MVATQVNGQTFVAKARIRKAARSEVQAFADRVLAPAVAKAIAAIVGEAVRESEARLTARIAELGAAMQEVRFVPWSEGKTFRAGNICSVGGAVYACTVDTETRPGPDSSGWLLLIAKPRDGRDGRDFTPPPPEPPGGPRMTRSHR